MRILIADDDSISRRMLETTLDKWGYEVVTTCTGKAACEALQAEDAPRLAILDWMMPEMDGVEVCRIIRSTPSKMPPYLILLTSKSTKGSVVEGLNSGADDYVTKPFDRDELNARLRVGLRILELQSSLTLRVQELEAALVQVKQLQGLVPICSYCKKIRDDQNYWQQVDIYLSARTDARFSHGICPQCMESVVQKELELAEVEAAKATSVGSDCVPPGLPPAPSDAG
jgi:sigma-B regulation protein RsbU (phosphoserine phosphatase)